MSYEQRQECWEWCREYIDRECIYRADEENLPIPARAPGGTYVWQVYLRRATFHPVFARKVGFMFWDHFKPVFEQQPFQICACAPSGPPIAIAVQQEARRLGIEVNLFIARREPKSFGIDNWFDGAANDLPVLLLDDVAASAEFLRNASARVQQKLGLPLHRNYFTLTNKVGRNFPKAGQYTENYLDNELISFFTMNNFCLTVGAFKEKYGHPPKWSGMVK
jgi:hypothetical protein